MKNKNRFLCFFFLMLGLLLACESDDAPKLPEDPPAPILNMNDSLALVSIYQKVVGWGTDAFPDPDSRDDIKKWIAIRGVMLDKENNEYRITGLRLQCSRTGGCGTVSSAIGNLEKLKELQILGKGFYGSLPKEISNLKELENLEVYQTNMESISDDLIFPESLDIILIWHNRKLKKVPRSVLFLKRKPRYEHLYGFAYNAFEGAFPDGIQADIAFEGNNFSYFPFSYLEKDLRINIGLNRITGDVPQEILDDSVKLYDLYQSAYPTQEGYGYSNMPPEEEVKKRYEEYLNNHPNESSK